MRNKTLVRVVTLLLVALMVLTTFAPAFTAYAAALLTVTKTTDCDASGTPDASVFTQEGEYKFQVNGSVSGSGLTLKCTDPTDVDTTSAKISGSEIEFGGLTITPKDEAANGGEWNNNDTFSITIGRVQTDDEPIVTSAYVDDSRIRKGESINLTATIVDTNYSGSKTVTESAVVFQQVDIPMNSLILAEDDGTRLPRANVEVFDFLTSDGQYDSVNEKWILISQEYLTADDQPSDQENAAKVRRIYGYENVLAEDSTTTSLFDVVRLCNVVEGQIDNSVQTINITSYAIQADNIAGITSAHWNETMDQAKLTEIFDVYMNQSGEIVSDDADNSNNQTIIGTTLNVSMTAPNRHLKLNTGNAEDTRTTLVYDVAYTGSNEEPIPVFESSNPDVATVDQAGNIQAVGVGTTTITMSAENPDTGNIASATLTVMVRDMNAGE